MWNNKTGDPFVTKWKFDNDNETLSFLTSNDSYCYDVDWGDGSNVAYFRGAASHTYASKGTYEVKIYPSKFPEFIISDTNRSHLISVEQWGDVAFKDLYQHI